MKKKTPLLESNRYLVATNIYFTKLTSGVTIDFMLPTQLFS